MSFDGNIAGLLGMSGRDDGVGNASPGFGGLRQRKANRHIHYYKATYGDDIDPDTGEVLNFKPSKAYSNPYKKSMAYNKRSSFNVNRAVANLPNPSTLINVALLAAIGIGGYKLYNKFFNADPIQDAIDTAQNNGKQAIGKIIVDSNTAKADTVSATAKSLDNKGLTTQSVHKKNAIALHDLMNSLWVDQDKIIKAIKAMHVQTFRLVSVAYGAQTLPTYSKWHLTTLSQNEPLILKDALKLVLSDSQEKQITAYLNVI